MKLTIERAAVSDLDEILRLNHLLFQNDLRFDETLNMGWTNSKKGRKYFLKRLKSRDECVFIAKVDKKAIGYIAGLLLKNQYYRLKLNYA